MRRLDEEAWGYQLAYRAIAHAKRGDATRAADCAVRARERLAPPALDRRLTALGL